MVDIITRYQEQSSCMWTSFGKLWCEKSNVSDQKITWQHDKWNILYIKGDPRSLWPLVVYQWNVLKNDIVFILCLTCIRMLTLYMSLYSVMRDISTEWIWIVVVDLCRKRWHCASKSKQLRAQTDLQNVHEEENIFNIFVRPSGHMKA